MPEFIKVGSVGQFREGRGKRVRVGDTEVAVFRLGDRWFAIQDSCPHQGASLADGKLDGDRVICLRHDWRFDLASGVSNHRSGARAKPFDVRIDGDELLVSATPRQDDRAQDAYPEADDWIPWDPDNFFKNKT